jgi:hypothetical protein
MNVRGVFAEPPEQRLFTVSVLRRLFKPDIVRLEIFTPALPAMCLLRRLIDQVDDQAAQRPKGGDRKSAKIKVDNVHFDPKPDGNSKEALLRRLRKHAPDIHAGLLRIDRLGLRARLRAAM